MEPLESLELLAQLINARLTKATKQSQDAEDNRIAAGLHLVQVRERLKTESPGTTWKAWCAANIQRSRRDVDRCLRLARAPDPVAALATERQTRREQMAQTRSGQKGTHVGPFPNAERPQVTQAKTLFRQFSFDERGKFLEWVKATGLY